MNARGGALHEVVSVLPDRADDMARLAILLADGEPIVTVIGKYNHGKSRLLNELIGRDTFAVADKRETVKLSDSVHQGVRWLDAPGLDADVGTEDDRHALHAAWLHADIRLFVHAAKEGELDAKELALLAELCADGERSKRQTLFVLSQVDQLADDAELQKVSHAIGAQWPDIGLNAVSSTRYRKGLDEGKKLMLEKSGMPSLRATIDAALARVPEARAHEAALLFDETREELAQLLIAQEKLLDDLRQTQRQQRVDFDHGLKSVIDKVSGDIDAMLNALGTDHASVPDTAKDAYAITAGKLERAHIQIAYSRACIAIDSFLAGHGVIGLPSEQETVARALNSVMVAVMGVSVKFRKDLRRMFCTDAGRERMQRDFAHYFELSADRKALAARILQSESMIDALNNASNALRALEGAT
ncbi:MULTISPECIES: GTPase [Caballeronia]|uniref:50S ribosome-binding GTPase n=1 Tax=Caballeronia jiangsuensis TaxID=1458357 RepID=A0ABW9CIM9_9BURK|nr:GTPase [Caballeronia sp. GaOx3]